MSLVLGSKTGWEVLTVLKNAIVNNWESVVTALEVDWDVEELVTTMPAAAVQLGHITEWLYNPVIGLVCTGAPFDPGYESYGGIRSWEVQAGLLFRHPQSRQNLQRMIEHYLQALWGSMLNGYMDGTGTVSGIIERRRDTDLTGVQIPANKQHRVGGYIQLYAIADHDI